MFCKKCGQQLEGNSKFCKNCGTEVEVLNDEEIADQQKNKNKINIGKVHIIISVIVILLLITGIASITLIIKNKTIGVFGHEVDELKVIMERDRLDLRNLMSSKDRYDHLNEIYILNDDQVNELRHLIGKLDKAVDEWEIEKGEETLTYLEALKIEIIDENKALTSSLKNKLENISPSSAYIEELNIMKSYKESVNRFLEEENYVKAMNKLQEWDKFLNMIMRGSDYVIKISQVDVSEYPRVKIYLCLESKATNQALDNLELQYFYLSEKPEGDAQYIKKQIEKVMQLNEVENINISMVADVSGSMQGEPLFYAKNIMKNFINNVQFDIGDKVSLISFADYVRSDVSFISNPQEIINAVNSMETGNQTALYDALYVAINQTVMQSGAKCIIAFTDGQDNASLCTPQIVVELAMRYHIPIFIIGVGAGMDTGNLQYIANQTGGFYRNINSISSMEDIYQMIYRQQKELYLLEYETTQDKDKIVKRNIYINYLNNDIGARSEYAYTPAILMEGISSSAQLFMNDFIIYDSDKRYVTVADLKQLTEQQLRLARNEIYARRGRRFVDVKLQEYFNRKPWYNPTIHPNDFKESIFNDYEKANAYFIRDYENLHGFN